MYNYPISFTGLADVDVRNFIKNPNLLRNQVLFWAISANVTDLAETLPPFLDNFLEAKLRPNALKAADIANLALNPRKSICQDDIFVRVVKSENISDADFKVRIFLCEKQNPSREFAREKKNFC